MAYNMGSSVRSKSGNNKGNAKAARKLREAEASKTITRRRQECAVHNHYLSEMQSREIVSAAGTVLEGKQIQYTDFISTRISKHF